ncbi:alpha/beta fold hydrolase [Streptomyces inhibens]|uniref:alpha/beta fold hydrolase n=1 Tax=Streptomyces inhibens TaxID=2293571 RepID=UPI001EE6FA82|nr:alpha/beta fold hydrolase [Streptomyces inhibens]
MLYDRAGTGWSDEIELPRTATEDADELRSLLRAVGVPVPYLLVGHSLGGAYVRRFAQLFPDEVAGLLLLEPSHEDWDAYLPEQLQPRKRRGVGATVAQRSRRWRWRRDCRRTGRWRASRRPNRASPWGVLRIA